MLGEEGQVYPEEHNSEVDFCPCAVKRVPCKEGEPVDESANDGEDSTHREDVMEVGNYVVSVM